jgi:hypothetical protein
VNALASGVWKAVCVCLCIDFGAHAPVLLTTSRAVRHLRRLRRLRLYTRRTCLGPEIYGLVPATP